MSRSTKRQPFAPIVGRQREQARDKRPASRILRRVNRARVRLGVEPIVADEAMNV